MAPDVKEDADDPSNMPYPSPNAENIDAGPFYGTGRDEMQEGPEANGHEDDQMQISEQQQQPSDHEQQQDQQPEPPIDDATMVNGSQAPNFDELRLAAQLGHGLTAESMVHPDSHLGVDDANLRAIMPHPDPGHPASPMYARDATPAESMMSHGMPIAIAPMHNYSVSDGVPPRKRSKVSRACDECRRKKIKCDAQSDNGEAPCSSCARLNIQCLFSRIPQKRGPSKGYIKELADRIHSIENKLESEGGLSHEDMERLFGTDRQRTAPDSGRKRPFSSISNGDVRTPTRPGVTALEQRPIQPAGATPEAVPHTDSSLAPRPVAIKIDDAAIQPDSAVDLSMADDMEVPEALDDALLEYFLTITQPVYPILANTLARTQELVGQCPLSVRTAFGAALLAVNEAPSGNARLASSLLHEWETDKTPSSMAVNIVHAQTLLMLVIDADSRASASLPYFLARAIALANSMKLWKYTPVEAASELDSDEQLCMRIWWSLVLMDRWHAAGTGKPSQIPDNSVVAPAGLVNVLGETCFHLTRLSKLLNRISFVISTLGPDASAAEPPMAGMLSDYIDNWREDLPSHIDHTQFPAIHMAYWHCRLLVFLITPDATAHEKWWPTKELIKLLTANGSIKAPLMNHFASLAAMSLGQALKEDATREDATKVLKDFIEKPLLVWNGLRERLLEQIRTTSSSGLAAMANEVVAEAEADETGVEDAASRNLQHLADLATAAGGAASDDGALGGSLAGGYLDVAS